MPEATLGEQLRRGRRSKGMTLRELATKVGLSPSLLSQVENDRTRPSVANLELLMNALDIAPSDLFVARRNVPDGAEPRSVPAREELAPPGAASGVINRAGTRPTLAMAGGPVMERLATNATPPFDQLMMTYAPGASSAYEGLHLRHPGTEVGYIIEGRLTLQLSFDIHELNAGDSFYFDSTIPHVYTNTSEAPARGLWMMLGYKEASPGSDGEVPKDDSYHWTAGSS